MTVDKCGLMGWKEVRESTSKETRLCVLLESGILFGDIP